MAEENIIQHPSQFLRCYCHLDALCLHVSRSNDNPGRQDFTTLPNWDQSKGCGFVYWVDSRTPISEQGSSSTSERCEQGSSSTSERCLRIREVIDCTVQNTLAAELCVAQESASACRDLLLQLRDLELDKITMSLDLYDMKPSLEELRKDKSRGKDKANEQKEEQEQEQEVVRIKKRKGKNVVEAVSKPDKKLLSGDALDFKVKYFNASIITTSEIQSALEGVVKKKDKESIADFAKLMVLFMLNSGFFTKSNFTLASAYVYYVYCFEEMNKVSWATTISSHMMKQIRKHSAKSPMSTGTCVVQLLYWFCEHTVDFISPVKDYETQYLRCAKWDLSVLIHKFPQVVGEGLDKKSKAKAKIPLKVSKELRDIIDDEQILLTRLYEPKETETTLEIWRRKLEYDSGQTGGHMEEGGFMDDDSPNTDTHDEFPGINSTLTEGSTQIVVNLQQNDSDPMMEGPEIEEEREDDYLGETGANVGDGGLVDHDSPNFDTPADESRAKCLSTDPIPVEVPTKIVDYL
ncbi:hypothetical protein IFM89_039957 [Coptis chinensis]|uniref:Aminotransferase-like plant mobile domain-containing protein n=1 Tax=Coptis chinensis TaxID=261450 RepID=A0A835GT76_9MAGN|nr:hypothetical protein IFM89_039957 [Coptis chinensis]